QHVPEIDPGIGGMRIDRQRLADEPVGFARLPALRLDRTEQIEGVELIGRGFEHAGVDSLGLPQPSLPLQRHRLLQRLPASHFTPPPAPRPPRGSFRYSRLSVRGTAGDTALMRCRCEFTLRCTTAAGRVCAVTA